MTIKQFGNFELTAVSDGTYSLDGGAFFGVVPKSMWQKKVTPDERNLVPTGLNSVVVRTGDKTILIETGIGNKLTEKMIKIYGQPARLLDNLSAAGFSPDRADALVWALADLLGLDRRGSSGGMLEFWAGKAGGEGVISRSLESRF